MRDVAATRPLHGWRRSFHMIDIKNYPKVIKTINEALNFGAIIEIKLERKGISVVEISRKVKNIEPIDK